jgi:hypothetical protein
LLIKADIKDLDFTAHTECTKWVYMRAKMQDMALLSISYTVCAVCLYNLLLEKCHFLEGFLTRKLASRLYFHLMRVHILHIVFFGS